jgi:hypothetical protein
VEHATMREQLCGHVVGAVTDATRCHGPGDGPTRRATGPATPFYMVITDSTMINPTWYRYPCDGAIVADEPTAAVLRGKVWPRGEPEPAAWTIEAVHEGGNLQGSPGFFGNSKDSEIFIDNVVVESLSGATTPTGNTSQGAQR